MNSIANRRASLLGWRGVAGMRFVTYGPGDGVLRYRLTMDVDYFANIGPTALGLSEAESMRSAAEMAGDIGYKAGYLGALVDVLPALVGDGNKVARKFIADTTLMIGEIAAGRYGRVALEKCERVLRVVVPALDWKEHPALAAETVFRAVLKLLKENNAWALDVLEFLKETTPTEAWKEDIVR